MNVGVVIQARLGSRRLPRKVLRPIHGVPLIQYLLDSIHQCETVDQCIVATSHHAHDDPIADYCRRRRIDCWRGSHDNVASRFLNIAAFHEWDYFVRLSGDSPLLDYRLVDRAVNLAKTRPCDLATNILSRTFPKGQSVEVLKTDVFARAYERMNSREEFEHVTRHYYHHANDYGIESFQYAPNRGDVQLSVDTARDFTRAAEILSQMTEPHWTYSVDAVLRLYDRLADEHRRAA